MFFSIVIILIAVAFVIAGGYYLVNRRKLSRADQSGKAKKICPTCKGTGKLEFIDLPNKPPKQCPTCRGTGYVDA
ncbi:hypothetical protein GF337_11425 [candidate division KSB1 bacterium]|nr:hypothetical protein [candidate division KSB1 bacterium]